MDHQAVVELLLDRFESEVERVGRDSIRLVPLNHVKKGLLDAQRDVELVHCIIDLFLDLTVLVEVAEPFASGDLNQCQT